VPHQIWKKNWLIIGSSKKLNMSNRFENSNENKINSLAMKKKDLKDKGKLNLMNMKRHSINNLRLNLEESNSKSI
jgi:hypothetical protein